MVVIALQVISAWKLQPVYIPLLVVQKELVNHSSPFPQAKVNFYCYLSNLIEIFAWEESSLQVCIDGFAVPANTKEGVDPFKFEVGEYTCGG